MKVIAGLDVQEKAHPDTLETLRAELDRIDAHFLVALGARVDVCRSIAHYKRAHGVPMMQPHRIGVVQERAARFAEANGLDLTFMKQFYDLIIGEKEIETLSAELIASVATYTNPNAGAL